MASTPARRQRVTPRATKSTVLLQPNRPGPPHSPAPLPTTSPLPPKVPTVPLCPTTRNDTALPPSSSRTLARWLLTARAQEPAKRRWGAVTKVLCLRRPNVHREQQGGQCTNCSLYSSYRAERRARALNRLDDWEAGYCHHRSAGKTEKCSQINTCVCTCVCVLD